MSRHILCRTEDSPSREHQRRLDASWQNEAKKLKEYDGSLAGQTDRGVGASTA
ncbi:MAG: hypothetical protein OJF62_002074 [Pseudolabrys sp.]|nr:hypothetical protein [Pseudolabrys sp.]